MRTPARKLNCLSVLHIHNSRKNGLDEFYKIIKVFFASVKK